MAAPSARPSPLVVQTIVEEHAALAAVIRALQVSVDIHNTVGTPDSECLQAMLSYLWDVTARLHHATENALFPRLRERCPALQPVLDRAKYDHRRAEASVRQLKIALTGWQIHGDGQRHASTLMLHTFVESYIGHMEVKENYILPVALDYLSAGDWCELEAAFVVPRLVGHTMMGSEDHRALLERIGVRGWKQKT